MSYELALKFESHFDILKQVTSNIEALKSHALINDTHMEAFAPLQMAAIAFEVGKGFSHRTNVKKYYEHFSEIVVPNLEQNCVSVCDPNE